MTAATLGPTDLLKPFLPPRVQAAPQDFGIYGVEFLPLAGAAVRQQATFTVEEDHAFLIVAASVLYTTGDDQVVGAGVGTPIPALVTLRTLVSGRQFTQHIVRGANMDDSPIDNWFGTGKSWMYWSLPVILQPKDTFVVLLTNLEAVAHNYRLSFIGARLYRKPSMDPWAFFRGGW